MKGFRAALLAMALVATLVPASPAQAASGSKSGSEAWPAWLPPVTTAAVLYGSLYATAFVVFQTARAGIVAVSAPGWVGAAQSFGTPAVIVLVMSHMVPALRLAVPEMVNSWFGQRPDLQNTPGGLTASATMDPRPGTRDQP